MHLAIIGHGIVGCATAAWLQREGHRVTFIDPLGAGEATSFGNAGSPSACLPVGMPGMWKKVPKWLLDPLWPLGPLPGLLEPFPVEWETQRAAIPTRASSSPTAICSPR